MKKATFPCLIAATAFVGISSAAHYQVYLLGGQSNGNGRADASELSPPLDAAQTDVFFYWHRTQSVANVGHILEDQWTDLAPGSGHGTSTPVHPKEFGSEVSFGRAMADAKSTENIAIIKYTHGGTNLHTQWAANGDRYSSFVSTVQAGLSALTIAGHTYELRGMLWQQGESDTGGTNADNYQANLTDLISRVRADVFAGGPLPFVVGSLSDSQYGNITTPGTGPYKVRQAQEAVAAADQAVGIVITDGYGTRTGDAIHLNAAGQVALGQNFASQMLSLEGPDVTAPEILTTSPADDASGVPASANLVATFNEAIKLVDGGTVTLRDLGPGADITITLPDSRVSASGSHLIIDPTADLNLLNPYAIQISANAVSDEAIPANVFGGIADDATWSFTTGTSEPVAETLAPPDNASGVAVDANLVINFDKPVQKGAGGNIVIKQNGGAAFETIPVSDGRVVVSGATVTIDPAGTFAIGAGYHVQIADSAIQDSEGNLWTGIPTTDTTTWNFTTILPADTIGTTGVFDENVDATNAIDTENPANSLTAFKAVVQTAFDNEVGGVIDWETGVTTTPSNGSASNNIVTEKRVAFGAGASKRLTITFDRPMELYTNDINGQVDVLSQQGSSRNAILPQGTSPTSVLFSMNIAGAKVTELGAAMPSRTTFGSLGVDFRVTATFSGGGNSVVEDTIGNIPGADDTFFHFTAPEGEFITSLGIAYLDDNGQGLTDGQRRPILDDFGFIAPEAGLPPDGLTTGVFDENLDATNAIDIELSPATLADFKTDVQTAFNANLGGVIDWETGFITNPSNGGTSNNNLGSSVSVGYGVNASETLTITFDEPMELFTNNIAGQASVLSQQGAAQNAIIPDDVEDVDYTMSFSGTDVIEIGAAIPSRTTYESLGVDFRGTATFSGGGSTVVDFTMGGTAGTGDTFLHVVAPGGESITSLAVTYLDDNGQGRTNGQRRPILDDFGFIVAPPSAGFADWISDPAFGLALSERGFNDDPDGDGLANGLEAWFGTHPGEFNDGLVNLATDGTTTTLSHPQNDSPVSGLTGSYQWSPDLDSWYAGDGVDGPPGGPTVTISSQTAGSTSNVTATSSEVQATVFLRVVAQN